MEQDYKLGGWLSNHDALLDPVVFQQLIDAVHHNHSVRDAKAVREEARAILNDRLQDYWFLVNNNIDEIIDAATPESERSLKNHPNWSATRVEALAQEIYQWLRKQGMWIDVYIYYNGKRMGTSGMVDGKEVFRYNGEPFVEEGYDPRHYFDYVASNHILSMSFEGPLYEALNACTPGWTKIEAEFNAIFEKHGCYFELGNCWNLSCYEV